LFEVFIHKFDEKIFSLARGKSEFGLGGMASKLHFARIATTLGVDVLIFNAKTPGAILDAESLSTGTYCSAKKCKISCQKKWLVAGSLPTAKIVVDFGAATALKNRKSLLLVGVRKIDGDFERGDIFEVFKNDETSPIAVARAKISSDEIKKKSQKKGVEIANADEIVVFS